MYKKYIKRLMDIICAVLALICFSWLYLFIAVLVRIRLGNPIIFSQERPGKDERIFKIYKFRTMTNERDENGNLLPDDQRLTKFGLSLRNASFDELPEAWNILRGDMSVVGPRPLLVEYLPYYNERQRRRHEVRPGLSGLSQINGRNILNWEEKFEFDLEYIENISFLLDLKIISATVVNAFIKKRGITHDKNVTMPFFLGSKD